jgi:hypothetical protein
MNYTSVKDKTLIVKNITSHSNMNRSSVKHETVMVNNITNHNPVNHSSVKPQTVIGQQHNQPQQYEPLLCQT